MTENEKYKIIDNNYFDILIKYSGSRELLLLHDDISIQILSDYGAVLYLPVSDDTTRLIAEYGYWAIPKCYSLNSRQSLEASGVNRLRRIPSVGLRGRDVIVGIIDTGIDYTNPVFRHGDGTSKIIAIWDQGIDSADRYPNAVYPTLYGTEYTSEQINLALSSENPRQIVPSTDEIGHGTMLAGIAAGSENRENNFSGVVPDAELIVVKLKQAKKNLTDFFAIPQGVPCYQENDILWAIQYIIDKARILKRPLALCLGLGTSQGSHDNSGLLNTVVSIYGDAVNVAVSIAAGNESNSRRHFYSPVDPASGPIPVELNIGENESGFSLELWGEPPTIYSMDILSPAGDYIPRISELLEGSQRVSFIFDQTVIYADNIMIEEETGKQLIILRFNNPTAGIWRFNVYGRGDLRGGFHIWLPSDNFLSKGTYFIRSNPYTTVTSPANSIVPITVAAYDPNSGALYTDSGKGYSTSNILNPTLAAPGVNIQCPALDHSFTTVSGTGAAAAHTAGITAMLLEWCVVDNNYPGVDTVGIKKFLIRGAKRNGNLQYPNQSWGYGIIDVYNAFNILKADIQS